MNLPLTSWSNTISSAARLGASAAAFAGCVHKVNELASHSAGIHEQTLMTQLAAFAAIDLLVASSSLTTRGKHGISVLPGAAMKMTNIAAMVTHVYREHYVPFNKKKNWLIIRVDVRKASPLKQKALKALGVGGELISSAASAVFKRDKTESAQRPIHTIELNITDLLVSISTHVIPTVYIVALTARNVLYLKNDILGRKFSLSTLSAALMAIPGFYHVGNHGVYAPFSIDKTGKMVSNLDHFQEHGGALSEMRVMKKIQLMARYIEPYGDKMISLIILFKGLTISKPLYLFSLISPYLPKHIKDEMRNWIGSQIIGLGKFIIQLVSPQGKDWTANDFGFEYHDSSGITSLAKGLFFLGYRLKAAGIRTPMGAVHSLETSQAKAAKRLLSAQSTEDPSLSEQEASDATLNVLRSPITTAKGGDVDTMNILGVSARVPIKELIEKFSGEVIELVKVMMQKGREAINESMRGKESTQFDADAILLAVVERANSLLLTLTSQTAGLAPPKELRMYKGVLTDIKQYIELPENLPSLTTTQLEGVAEGKRANSSYEIMQKALKESSLEKPKWFEYLYRDNPKWLVRTALNVFKSYPDQEQALLESVNCFFLALAEAVKKPSQYNKLIEAINNDIDLLEALETGGKCMPRTKEMLETLGNIGRACLSVNTNIDLALFLVNKQAEVVKVRREVFSRKTMVMASMFKIFPDGFSEIVQAIMNQEPYGVDTSLVTLIKTYENIIRSALYFSSSLLHERAVNIHVLDRHMGREKATMDKIAQAERLDTIAQARVMQKLLADLMEMVHHPAVAYISYRSLLSAFTPHFTGHLLTREVQQTWADKKDQLAVIEAALAIKTRESDLAIYKRDGGYDEKALAAWQSSINQAKQVFSCFVDNNDEKDAKTYLNELLSALFHPSAVGIGGDALKNIEPKLSPSAEAILERMHDEGHLAGRAYILLSLNKLDEISKKQEHRFFHNQDLLDPKALTPEFFGLMGLSPDAASALHSMPENPVLARLKADGRPTDLETVYNQFLGFLMIDADLEKDNYLTATFDEEERGYIEEALKEATLPFETVDEVTEFQAMLKQKSQMWFIAFEQRKKQLQKAFNTHLAPAVLTHLNLAKPEKSELEARLEEPVGYAFSNLCLQTQNHVEPENLERAKAVFKALLTGNPDDYLDLEESGLVEGIVNATGGGDANPDAAADPSSTESDMRKGFKEMSRLSKKGLSHLMKNLIRGLVMETDSFKSRMLARKNGERGDFSTLALSASEVKTIMRQLSQVLSFFSITGLIAPKLTYVRAILEAGYPTANMVIPMKGETNDTTDIWIPSLDSQLDNMNMGGSHGEQNEEVTRQLQEMESKAHLLKVDTPSVFTFSMSMIYELLAAAAQSKGASEALRILQAKGQHQKHEDNVSADVWVAKIQALINSDHADPVFLDKAQQLMREIANEKRGGSLTDIGLTIAKLMPILMGTGD